MSAAERTTVPLQFVIGCYTHIFRDLQIVSQSRDSCIRIAATRFRRAIETCPSAMLDITFEQFPLGACGDATPLLGTYLASEGFGAFDYILGERWETNDSSEPRSQSHAWLMQDGLLVDITADQFLGISEVVIVTRSLPALHASFAWTVEHEADYRIYDSHTAARLEIIYRKILAAMGPVE